MGWPSHRIQRTEQWSCSHDDTTPTDNTWELLDIQGMRDKDMLVLADDDAVLYAYEMLGSQLIMITAWLMMTERLMMIMVAMIMMNMQFRKVRGSRHTGYAYRKVLTSMGLTNKEAIRSALTQYFNYVTILNAYQESFLSQVCCQSRKHIVVDIL